MAPGPSRLRRGQPGGRAPGPAGPALLLHAAVLRGAPRCNSTTAANGAVSTPPCCGSTPGGGTWWATISTAACPGRSGSTAWKATWPRGEPGSAVLPEGFDPDAALPDVPWRIGEGALVTVEVQVDAALAALVLDEVGQSALARRQDDGSVVLHLEVTNIDALRSWLFELGDHAEVLGPDEVRAEVVSWLEAMSGAP